MGCVTAGDGVCHSIVRPGQGGPVQDGLDAGAVSTVSRVSAEAAIPDGYVGTAGRHRGTDGLVHRYQKSGDDSYDDYCDPYDDPELLALRLGRFRRHGSTLLVLMAGLIHPTKPRPCATMMILEAAMLSIASDFLL